MCKPLALLQPLLEGAARRAQPQRVGQEQRAVEQRLPEVLPRTPGPPSSKATAAGKARGLSDAPKLSTTSGSAANEPPLVYGHIGKCAGTTVYRWLSRHFPTTGKRRHVEDSSVEYVGHGAFVLGEKSESDARKYVFAVRDPVARWVSGFLSRLRQGCPDHGPQLCFL